MKVDFKASFARDLKRLRNKQLHRQVQEVIEEIESAETLSELANLKKLSVKGRYYRIKLGEYRIGLVIDDGAVTFVRFLHRSEIYRYFPQVGFVENHGLTSEVNPTSNPGASSEHFSFKARGRVVARRVSTRWH
jgi:mRNA interferase RelE/StbE